MRIAKCVAFHSKLLSIALDSFIPVQCLHYFSPEVMTDINVFLLVYSKVVGMT